MNLSDAWVDFIAGWCSGGVAVVVCQPIDTVLTRFQAGSVVVQSTTTTAAAAAALRNPSSAGGIARALVQDVGATSLWRGSSAMIAAVPMQNALLMGGYGVGKKWADGGNNNNNNSNDSTNRMSAIFVGGCIGGILQSFLMSPVELIKVNQQVIGKHVVDAGKEVVGGLFKFHSRSYCSSVATKSASAGGSGGGGSSSSRSSSAWRGLGATLLRDGIPHGVWFVSYEMGKHYLEDQLSISTKSGTTTQTTQQQFLVPFVSGAFAATVAWGVGYPFDLIKTRIQAGGTHGILGTAQELVQQANGRVFVGLYRGFGLKLVRAIPASMIGFATYEFVAKTIQENTIPSIS